MKTILKLLVFCILLVVGCSKDHNESLKEAKVEPTSKQEVEVEKPTIENNLPEEVVLSFSPIDFLPIDCESIFFTPDTWMFKESISIGKENNEEILLNIYQEVTDLTSLPDIYYGVLNVHDKYYMINDLSLSIMNEGVVDQSHIQVYQRSFSADSPYELIASIDVSQNGPGLNCYIVYNTKTQEYSFFEAWGDLGFIDLDADGVEECVVEFKGLHLAMPDLSIIRANGDKLEICNSLLKHFNTEQGSSILLERAQPQPLINVNLTVDSETSGVQYFYDHGVLNRSK